MGLREHCSLGWGRYVDPPLLSGEVERVVALSLRCGPCVSWCASSLRTPLPSTIFSIRENYRYYSFELPFVFSFLRPLAVRFSFVGPFPFGGIFGRRGLSKQGVGLYTGYQLALWVGIYGAV